MPALSGLQVPRERFATPICEMTHTQRRQVGGKAPPEPVAVLRGHTSDVQAVAFTSSGVLASGCVPPWLPGARTQHSSCMSQYLSRVCV
jgi:hypothetical protein